MRELTNNEKYIIKGVAMLKEHAISAYKLTRISQTTPYPLSHPTIKRVFSNPDLAEYLTNPKLSRHVYDGLLCCIAKVAKEIEKQNTKKEKV